MPESNAQRRRPARHRTKARRLWGAALAGSIALALGSGASAGQQAAPAVQPQAFRVEVFDSEFQKLIDPKVQLQTIASGLGFSDGPVWVRGTAQASGYLLVSSIIGNVIYKITPAGAVSVYLDRAGYTGSDFAHDGKLSTIAGLHIILIGPNCTGIDSQGRLVWCAGQDRAIKRLEKDGTTTIVARAAGGKRFNGPNDVAIAGNGAIYFTDSDVGLRGGINGGLAEMPNAVWMIRDGKVTEVVSREALGAEPNGIALSPDDKYLYLSAGTMTADPRLMRYPVREDGTVGPGEVFTRGPGIGDGMKTDRQGNVYSTGPMPGIVRVTSPAGKLLGLLHMPTTGNREPKRLICASALAFGGDDARTLYVTACDDVYAIKLRLPGQLEGSSQP